MVCGKEATAFKEVSIPDYTDYKVTFGALIRKHTNQGDMNIAWIEKVRKQYFTVSRLRMEKFATRHG